MSRTVVALEAAALLPGETVRVQCPWCNGGGSRERTMNITQMEDGRVAYHCFRANCDGSGYIGPAGPAQGKRPLIRQDREPLAVEDFPDEWKEAVWNAWKLDEVHINESCMYKAGDRIALSVYGPKAGLRGYVLRALPGSALHPKALTYKMEGDEPWLGWSRITLRAHSRESVVVVEDLISAARISAHGVRSVALNGVHCPPHAVEELMNNAERVYWALDRDAFARAAQYAKEFSPWFGLSMAVLLDKDVKNMDVEESRTWLQSLSLLPS